MTSKAALPVGHEPPPSSSTLPSLLLSCVLKDDLKEIPYVLDTESHRRDPRHENPSCPPSAARSARHIYKTLWFRALFALPGFWSAHFSALHTEGTQHFCFLECSMSSLPFGPVHTCICAAPYSPTLPSSCKAPTYTASSPWTSLPPLLPTLRLQQVLSGPGSQCSTSQAPTAVWIWCMRNGVQVRTGLDFSWRQGPPGFQAKEEGKDTSGEQ